MSLRAVVSIGTNSTRLLIVDGERVIASQSRSTRLGTGLTEGGALNRLARGRTLATVANYMLVVRRRGADLACIATSAMRRASDGGQFAIDVERLTGVPLRVLSGSEEATYSFFGATRGRSGTRRIGAIDVGGGSAELAVDVPVLARERGAVEWALSAEVGAVRLAERHPLLLGRRALDAAERETLLQLVRADVRPIIAPFACAKPVDEAIAVGGTAFTAAAMIAEADVHDGVSFDAESRAQLIDALLARDLAGRRELAFIRAQRADILPAGIIIIDEICRMLEIDQLTIGEADLLRGFLDRTT